MRGSRAILIAAGLIAAAGPAAFAAPGAAPGVRPPMHAPQSVSVWRGGERRAVEERSRRVEGDRRNRLGQLGVVGAGEGEAPAGEEEQAPQAAVYCPQVPANGGAAARSAGPRIIEIRGTARRGPWPVVVYGDPSP
ncbi:MAG: hypothetical protein ABSC22_19835 [Roseiarcus sp.]|jgi:hypothetical protein